MEHFESELKRDAFRFNMNSRENQTELLKETVKTERAVQNRKKFSARFRESVTNRVTPVYSHKGARVYSRYGLGVEYAIIRFQQIT